MFFTFFVYVIELNYFILQIFIIISKALNGSLIRRINN
jgi:hypothetical protein